jgi:hypothetical protein
MCCGWLEIVVFVENRYVEIVVKYVYKSDEMSSSDRRRNIIETKTVCVYTSLSFLKIVNDSIQ